MQEQSQNCSQKWRNHTLPRVQLLNMFNAKEWMNSHIVQDITGYVHQHQFKFEMQSGTVVTIYKKWSTSKEWIVLQPSSQETGQHFSIVKSIPKEAPSCIKPSFDVLI